MSSSTVALPTDVQKLLKENPVLETLPNGRIRCNLTGHEMPARGEVLQKHMAGPKFRRLLKIKKIMDVHGEIFEDIGYVYLCKATGRQVAKDPEDIERHLGGKLFKKAIATATKELEKESNIVDKMAHIDDSGASDIDDEDDEDEDEGSDEDEEYPELLEANRGGEVDDDSYDFAVMDTEMDTSASARKRKADTSTGSKKKRQK